MKKLLILLTILIVITNVALGQTELFFSEYVEGSSYNKALEIYNGTGTSIDLSVGYIIEVYFNGSSSPGTIIPLTGIVDPGDVYIVSDDGADPAILAQTDQTTTSSLWNGDDAVLLKNGSVVIDAIGQTGFDPGSYWGGGDATTQNHTLRRKESIIEGDANGSDAFDPSAEWDGYASNTFDGLGSHSTSNTQTVIINEVDADQVSTDAAEFIELYDGGVGNTDLTGLVLVLHNGSDDASYDAFDLDGYSTDANGYFVIAGNAATVPNCDLVVSPSTNLIQNGADAVALYVGDAVDYPEDTPISTDNLVDAVVYDTNDGDDAGLLVLLNAGQPQVNEYGGGDGTGHSIQRSPNGSGGARNTDTYSQFPPTPGEKNAESFPPPPVVINELDADTPGTDAAEFIELYDGGVGNTDLTGLVLVLFNGTGDASYAAFDLDGYSTDANGYFVIAGDAANVPNCDLDVSPNINLIQNGADAVALYVSDAADYPSGTPISTANLVDALVYDTDDADDAGLLVLLNAGQPQVNENGSGDKTGHSIQRSPNGSGGARNTDTYSQFPPTPGEENGAKSNTVPSITGITHIPIKVNSSNTVSISADVSDDGTVTGVELHWGTTSGSLPNIIAMSLTAGSTYTTDTNIPAQTHGTTVYYEIDATDNDSETSTSSEQSYYVSDFDLEPTNHVTNFVVTKCGANTIILSWHENDGANSPSGYLIKASTTTTISNPIDGTPVVDNPTIGDNSGTVNLPDGRINYEWTGLNANTTYYFKIYPYSNSGGNIDYKTTATVPNGFNTTTTTTLAVTYYATAAGLTGAALKAELNDIISGHSMYTYTTSGTDTWDMLKLTDKDPSNPNNVILIYKGTSVDAAQEYNSGAGWTREHVWPQSHGDFGTGQGIGTDAHHLRPCDMSVNSSRSNLDFDNGGVQHVEATGCYYDSDSWEPRNAVKGDIARMVFYLATRYEGEGGDLDLELTETIPSSPNKEPLLAKLFTLYQWHIADPVDAYERKRNEIIYSFQGNRNPFIDNPSYVSLIWNEDGSLPVELSEFKGSYSNGVVELSWTTESEVNNLGFNVYRSENGNDEFQQINASLIEGAGNSTTANDYSFTDTEIVPGTIYHFKIEDVSNDGKTKMHGSITVVTEKMDNNIANNFELGNAYPNPFNPTTRISYTLPKSSFVKIKVYDNSGNLVDELVSNQQEQGYHTVTFDATNQPSGIYFYKLTTDGFTDVKKCLLVK